MARIACLIMALLVLSVQYLNSQSIESLPGFQSVLPGKETEVSPIPQTYDELPGVTFILTTVANESWSFEFTLPEFLIRRDGLDSLRCVYNDSSVVFSPEYYFVEPERLRFYNPGRSIIITADNRGALLVGIGMRVNVPDSLPWCLDYVGAVSIKAHRLSDFVTLESVDTFYLTTGAFVKHASMNSPDLVISHVLQGQSYTLFPQNQTIEPTLTGREMGSVTVFEYWGDPFARFNLFFVLPQKLTGAVSGQPLTCSFPVSTARRREGDVRYDPNLPVALELDSTGHATFELGISFTIAADLPPDRYSADLIVTGTHSCGGFLLSSGVVEVRVTVEENSLPTSYVLFQNFPNPVNGTTQIRYQLPTPTDVELTLYSTLGQKVATLVDEFQYAGEHSVSISTDDFPTGVYFYRLRSPSFTSGRKLIIAR